MGGMLGSHPKRSLLSHLRRLSDAADGPDQDRARARFPDCYSRLILSVARQTPRHHDVVMARYAFAVEGFGSRATGDSVQLKSGARARLTSTVGSAVSRRAHLPVDRRST